MIALGDMIREALAHMAAGPPDNGVSHRRALAALAALEVDLDRLRAWHDNTGPIIAALAIYGSSANIEALVAKARALNEASGRAVDAQERLST